MVGARADAGVERHRWAVCWAGATTVRWTCCSTRRRSSTAMPCCRMGHWCTANMVAARSADPTARALRPRRMGRRGQPTQRPNDLIVALTGRSGSTTRPSDWKIPGKACPGIRKAGAPRSAGSAMTAWFGGWSTWPSPTASPSRPINGRCTRPRPRSMARRGRDLCIRLGRHHAVQSAPVCDGGRGRSGWLHGRPARLAMEQFGKGCRDFRSRRYASRHRADARDMQQLHIRQSGNTAVRNRRCTPLDAESDVATAGCT